MAAQKKPKKVRVAQSVAKLLQNGPAAAFFNGDYVDLIYTYVLVLRGVWMGHVKDAMRAPFIRAKQNHPHPYSVWLEEYISKVVPERVAALQMIVTQAFNGTTESSPAADRAIAALWNAPESCTAVRQSIVTDSLAWAGSAEVADEIRGRIVMLYHQR
jgi:hypothetical protein